MSETKKLKPWAAGPFELIRHAEGHREANTDFDKRMALVSYDNAIEVSITTFLQLAPLQRGGRTYERKAVESWLSNFHTKLEFLDHFASAEKIPIEVSIDEIVWYHRLRNELYHAGNGMTPEGHCIEGARAAAIWVFSVLFGIDGNDFLKPAKASTSPPSRASASSGAGSANTLFLETYIEMERMILWALRAMGALPEQTHHIPVARGWTELSNRQAVSNEMSAVVKRASSIRNAVVHGAPVDLSEEELLNLAMEVEGVTMHLRELCRRADPKL